MTSRGLYEAIDHVRDPIHGYIGLSEVERDLVDTPELQRLRHITQLGATSKVYPSATHTRFEHSLGVMHLAGRLANTLGLSDKEVTAARLAGLLHDTGHSIYSHTSEHVLERHGISHEDLSCEVVRQYEDRIPVETELVIDYINGDASPNIVAGTLDVDRMDYLMRDAYYAGVEHGSIDVETLLQFATVTDDDDLGLRAKGVPAMNEFLNARLLMYQSVYMHETVRAFDAELKRAITCFTQDAEPDALIGATEPELYAELNQYPSFQRYEQRNARRICIDIPLVDAPSNLVEQLDQLNGYEFAEQLARESGIDAKHILVQTPMSSVNSFGDVPIVYYDSETKPLSEVSSLHAHLEHEYQRENRFTVYVDEIYIERVQKAFTALFE